MPKFDVKKMPGARKRPMPEFVAPQLATLFGNAPEGDQWLHEVKFDGYRLLGHLSKGSVVLWTRNQNDWTSKFASIARALKDFPANSAILDGEVMALDDKGRASFQKLQQSLKLGDTKLIFQIFDLIYFDGYDLTATPLIQRKMLLEHLFSSVSARSPLRYSDHVIGNGRAFFKQACEYGIEGVVSKVVDSKYESTRNRNWLKIKCHQRQEFVIAGYTPSKKAFPGFGSLALGVYDKGKLIYAGQVGTGFSIKQRLEIQKKLDNLSRPSAPFDVKPKDPRLRDAVWSQPKLVAEVEFTEWTDDGAIRHPSFKGLREDKSAKEVRRELPAK